MTKNITPKGYTTGREAIAAEPLQAKEQPKKIPSPQEIFLEAPLYSSYEIDISNYQDVIRLEFFKGTLDTFCVECNRDSVYKSTVSLPAIGPAGTRTAPKNVDELLKTNIVWFDYNTVFSVEPEMPPVQLHEHDDRKNYAMKDRAFNVKFECTRVANHKLIFYFVFRNATLTKVGQYPSLADILGDSLKKYKQVLTKEQLGEFSRAVGLSAHGIGIGAFVYLRRIFEILVDEAHQKAIREDGWDDGKFLQSKMDEKIKLLEKYLPKFLVENRSVYSILSVGVHTLSENECLGLFEPVKLAIELMLDEKVEEREKAEKISRTSKMMNEIKSKLK